MPGNTTNQYPYPLASEPVAQGAQAIQNLAQAVDTRLGARATGHVTANFNNTVTVNITVTFASGRFQASQTPRVVACGSGTYATQFIAGATSISNTQMTLAVRQYNGSASSLSVGVDWYAST